MKNLKRSNFILFILILFLQGCATSSFRVIQNDGVIKLFATPDRVIMKCEALENGHFGFLMSILTDKKKVIPSFITLQHSKKSCTRVLVILKKIMKGSRPVYIAGYGDLKSDYSEEGARPIVYSFPRYGKFQEETGVLTFVYMANKRGQCYGAYTGLEKPCPDEQFAPPKNTKW